MKQDDAIATLRNCLNAPDDVNVVDLRNVFCHSIERSRRDALLLTEPELGAQVCDVLRRRWFTADESMRYQISVSAEALMDSLTYEQAERSGLPGVLILLAAFGSPKDRASVYLATFDSSVLGRPDTVLRRTASRIMLPMERDQGLLGIAAGGLRRSRWDPWMLEMTPILEGKLGYELFERVLIEGIVFKWDTQDLDPLQLFRIVVPKPKSHASRRFIDNVEKGANARDVIYSLMEAGKWQSWEGNRHDVESRQ
jgi:hypothetical protein